MKLRTLALALALILSLHRATFAQTAAPSYRVQSGIVYAQGATGPLLADAYIPSGAGPFPGIVFIHGGGWVNGNRTQMAKLIQDLAGRGYVGFTIDYDVDPVHYPASLHESLDAVRYLREHAKELRLDPARIAVAGSSAGGELAALVALTPEARVQAAVILNGVLDLTALGDKSSMVTDYLGGLCSAKLDACRAASPLMQVHAGAPPFFVGHGTEDQTVPFAQAEAFSTALRAAGVQVRLLTATGGKHTYWASEQFYAKNRDDIANFLSLALQTRPPAGK